MLTVIIYQKSAQPFLDRYKALFEHFEETGKIAFCFWDEHGRDAASILPEIQTVTHGIRDWRALVVMPLEAEEDEKLKSRGNNPYDYLINDPDSSYYENFPSQLQDLDIPLVRLSWVLDDIPQITHSYSETITLSTQRSEFHQYKKKESIMKLQQEQENWQDLHDAYSLRCDKPREIFFLKGRSRQVELFPSIRDSELKERHETDSSNFRFRNRYAPRSRFFIQDCARPSHARYSEDLFGFWMSALTLALSSFRSGIVEADKVYQIKSVIDLHEIQKFYSSYYYKLDFVQSTAFSEVEETRTQAALGKENEELPPYQKKIEVELKPAKSDLFLDEKMVGLTTDMPVDEVPWFNDAISTSLSRLKAYRRAVYISLDRAGKQSRYTVMNSLYNNVDLDEYQYSFIKEELDQLEQKILNQNTNRPIPFIQTERKLKEQRRRIIHRMKQRMDLFQAVVCVAVGGVLLLLGYLPPIFREFSSSQPSGPDAIFWSLFTVVGVAAVGLVALYVFQQIVRKRVIKYNIEMKWLVEHVQSAEAFFTRYLTDLVTYMSGRTLLQTFTRRNQMISHRISLLNDHIDHLKGRLEAVSGWLGDFDMRILPDSGESQEIVFNFDIPPENNSGYALQKSLKDLQIPVMEGQMTPSPYPFIIRLDLYREPLFEHESGFYKEEISDEKSDSNS